MSLTVEIKVNGCLIGHLYFLNQERDVGDEATYGVIYLKIDPHKIYETTLLHKRSNGAEALIAKGMEWAAKQRRTDDEET